MTQCRSLAEPNAEKAVAKLKKNPKSSIPKLADAFYELQWEDEDYTQMLSAVGQNEDDKVTRLQLIYCGREVSLLEDMPIFTLVRDASCSMAVEGKLISRNHASIEYKKGKFIFKDSSTNGTYIRTEEGRNVYVRREEVALWGLGNISLGRVPEEDEENLIQYISR